MAKTERVGVVEGREIALLGATERAARTGRAQTLLTLAGTVLPTDRETAQDYLRQALELVDRLVLDDQVTAAYRKANRKDRAGTDGHQPGGTASPEP